MAQKSFNKTVPFMEASENFTDLVLPFPPGLPNLGNSCYLNAILQCLLTIHPLVDWLLSYPQTVQNQLPAVKGQKLTPVLAKLVKAIFRQNFQSELEHFRCVVGELVEEFKEPHQQDAQEFLLFLLNRLHDENVIENTSKIREILSGQIHIQATCTSCSTHSTHSLFSAKKGPSKAISGGYDGNQVFLSLTVPITFDPNASRENDRDQMVIVNEIVEKPFPLCQRHLLHVGSKTGMKRVYTQLATIVSSDSPLHPSNVKKANHTQGSHAQDIENSSSFQGNLSSSDSLSAISQEKFILVQATSSGFGDWFLEDSEFAGNLLDGLNVENDFLPQNGTNGEKMKSNLLNDDALFLVHIESPTLTVGTNDGPSLMRSGSGNVDCHDQFFNQDESSLRLLLIHVTETTVGTQNQHSYNNHQAYQYQRGNSDDGRHKFKRFSPPLTVQVRKDIDFSDLSRSVITSLTEFNRNKFSDMPTCEELINSFSDNSLRFLIVDAGPEEDCEIVNSPSTVWPLLHSTVDVSSVSVPHWLSPNSNGVSNGPKLLRLLVVWPHQPLDLLANFNLSIGPVSMPDKSTPSHCLMFNRSNTTATGQPAERKAKPSNRDEKSAFGTGVSSSSSFTSTSADLNIEKCLRKFVEVEQLGDTKSTTCPNCYKTQETIRLKTSLTKPPKYMLLHLNRFVQVPGQNSLMKITSCVAYPTNGLDISFMMDDKKKHFKALEVMQPRASSSGLIYDLVAVCSHVGSLQTGHITAYCRNLFVDEWWHYNDQRVQRISPSQIVVPGAYILFYRKRDDYKTDSAKWQTLYKHCLTSQCKD